MSDSRKSARSKKTVTYSGFDDGDCSDDDFARATPPPSKRTKLEKKDKLSKTKKVAAKMESREKSEANAVTVTSRGPRKERVPLDDKVFDREMQLALEMSMQDSDNSQTNESTTNQQTAGRTKNIEAQIHTGSLAKTPLLDRSPDNTQSEDKENLVVKPTRPAPSFPEPSDEIVLVESLDEEEVATGRRKRKAAKEAVAKQRKMTSGDSDREDEDEDDFKADAVDDSSSDDGGESDSDYEEFTSSKKAKTAKGKGKSPRSTERGKKAGGGARTKTTPGDKKSKPATKGSKVTNSTPKASPPVTPLARRPPATGPIRGFTPPAMTGVKNSQQTNQRVLPSPAAVKKPWSSPSASSDSNPLGGVKLVSPGQPLRLGLSRNVRIKPLHPNAQVH